MSVAFLFIFGVCAWFRPVFGFAMFILFMTPVRNVLMSIYHPYTLVFLLMPAIIRLLSRRGRALRAVEICALVFSLILLVREFAMLPPGFPITKFIYLPLLASTWGLQLLAFNALKEKEVSSLRIWMSVAGIVVGAWGTLIYLTNSSYLISMAKSSSFFASASLYGNTESLVANRFIVTGLYGVVPYAYWYVLRGALNSVRQHLIGNVVMWGGVVAILITVGVSLTRSLMIVLASGTVVMVVTGTVALSIPQILRKKKSRKNRTSTIAAVAIGICVFGAGIHFLDFSAIIDPFTKRFSTLSQQDQTVAMRLNQSSFAWNYIKENNGCLFGATNAQSLVGVDTAVFLRIWLLYGILGVIAFAGMFAGAFVILFKCWFTPRLSQEDILLRSMLTAWALAYVYAMLAGYNLSEEVVFFAVLFFSEVSRLNSKRLKSSTLQPVQFAR